MNSTNEILGIVSKEEVPAESTRAAGLRLNFRHAPLREVLIYLNDAAGLLIEVEPNVEIERPIELWNDEPVNKEEAIRLLKQALNEKGYAANNKGGMLSIFSRHDAKRHYIPLPELSCSAFAG